MYNGSVTFQGTIFNNYCSDESIKALNQIEWQKIGDNKWKTVKKNFMPYMFYNITGIHLPSVLAVFDTCKAKAGYSLNQKQIDYYLTYEETEHKEPVGDPLKKAVFTAVVMYGDEEIIKYKTGSCCDFLGLFPKLETQYNK